ncbi:MAG TPA: hypothetical protein DCZ10_15855 [Pelotomaculum sp.]|nr:hypothetical protein [Pelotomaculum sp.]
MFTTKDPLGRNVVLKASTWNVHIVKGHNEMYKQENLVRKVIERPAFILKDRDSDDRDNYFDLCHHPKNGSLSILKVVVEFSDSTGDVVTAYPIKNTITQATTVRGVVYERP